MGTEIIRVKQLSKYGVQVEDGTYVNWSKKISEAEKGKVVAGGVYTVDMFRAESGKGYINSVTSNNDAPKLVAPVFNNTPLVKEIKTVSKAAFKATEAMSKAEWSAKDRSQLIGGLSHDAASLAVPILGMQADQSVLCALTIYKQLLEGMLKIRDEVK